MVAVVFAVLVAFLLGGWGGYFVKTVSLPAARTLPISDVTRQVSVESPEPATGRTRGGIQP